MAISKTDKQKLMKALVKTGKVKTMAELDAAAENFLKFFGRNAAFKDDRTYVFARMVKFMEAVGDFSKAVSVSQGVGMPTDVKKSAKAKKDAVAEQLADVLIAGLAIGKTFDLDMAKVLDQRVSELNKRFTGVLGKEIK